MSALKKIKHSDKTVSVWRDDTSDRQTAKVALKRRSLRWDLNFTKDLALQRAEGEPFQAQGRANSKSLK